MRILTQYFDKNGDIDVYEFMNTFQEILNKHSDGMYCSIQAKPILKKVYNQACFKQMLDSA